MTKSQIIRIFICFWLIIGSGFFPTNIWQIIGPFCFGYFVADIFSPLKAKY